MEITVRGFYAVWTLCNAPLALMVSLVNVVSRLQTL